MPLIEQLAQAVPCVTSNSRACAFQLVRGLGNLMEGQPLMAAFKSINLLVADHKGNQEATSHTETLRSDFPSMGPSGAVINTNQTATRRHVAGTERRAESPPACSRVGEIERTETRRRDRSPSYARGKKKIGPDQSRGEEEAQGDPPKPAKRERSAGADWGPSLTTLELEKKETLTRTEGSPKNAEETNEESTGPGTHPQRSRKWTATLRRRDTIPPHSRRIPRKKSRRKTVKQRSPWPRDT